MKMKAFRHMNKRERIVHRIKLILQEEQPLTIGEIISRLGKDKYRWMPDSSNQLAQLIRGHFNVNQVRLHWETGTQYEYSLKEE